MVARGDLGVELSLEMVPVAQKMLIRKSNEAGKPVITATQMLSTMEQADVPTRAEVSDISNAVLDGTDATMTSAETAMSSHPVLVVSTMKKILKTTEHYMPPRSVLRSISTKTFDETQLRLAIAKSALEAAEFSQAKAIIVFSLSGEMSKLISAGRPRCPIVSFTPVEHAHVINQLRLMYGIYPFELHFAKYIDTTVSKAEEIVLNHKIVNKGDWVVLCGGSNLPISGLSNITKIYKLGEFLQQFLEKYTPGLLHHKEGTESPK